MVTLVSALLTFQVLLEVATAAVGVVVVANVTVVLWTLDDWLRRWVPPGGLGTVLQGFFVVRLLLSSATLATGLARRFEVVTVVTVVLVT